LVYVYHAFQTGSSQETILANNILINVRIPHHAVIGHWFDITSILQVCFILIAIYLVRKTKIFTILLSCFLFAAGLTIIQGIMDNPTLALLFPWRISVILVPMATTILLAKIVSTLSARFESSLERRDQMIVSMSIGLISVLAFVGVVRFVLESRLHPTPADRGLFEYISNSKRPADVNLIPTKLQDFRLETGAAAYVDFKSIPYSANEVIEWNRRINRAEEFYRNGLKSCKSMNQFVHEEEINQVILEKPNGYPGCGSWEIVFEDSSYQVMRFEVEEKDDGF
jgi:hypothetical protein